MKVEERFLNYVSYWTTSDEEGTQNPTSEREFSLAKVLEQELKDLGLTKVLLSDTCYVYGLLPATPGMEDKQAIGLIAHMDTAPDFSGENVKPQIIEKYDGKDILLKGNNSWLKVSDFPSLKSLKGDRLITTDGTTLLGADDKAGIAEILTAVEEIIKDGTPHGDIWIGFTPDEEVGMGPNSFDLDYFKADYAYTVDGAYEADIAYENFNAASAEFEITGVSVHPGEAKDIMVNAGLIACEIAMKLPKRETPAHTEDREGFFHLTDISGDVVSAKLSYIIRDHDKNTFESRLNRLRALEVEMNQKYGANTVALTITHSYENMLSVIEEHMHVVELAKDAIFAVGLEPVSYPVRGGTDGARLSFMGLPCPNLGTGGYGFHGPYEHVSVNAMERVVKILKEIVSNPLDK
ncbi:MAG: peptidase T [Agathobacter sp.]|nr:peptidase T [Agathobacter sp.]MBQ6812865.1 peptidase T [Agathobacter sp.]